jgi:hypothetical protein
MAAGLMVGRKGMVSLAVGVAAMAGAQWLLKRQKRKQSAPALPAPVAPPQAGTSPADSAGPDCPAQQPVVASPFAQLDLKPEDTSPVLIYEQQPEMPSRSALPAGTVWFALFNEAPIVSLEGPPPGAAHSSESLPTPPEELQPEFDLEALPESFFSEAPGKTDAMEESGAADGPAYAASDVCPIMSAFELERVNVVSDPHPAPVPDTTDEAPESPPLLDENPQIVAKASATELECVARPVFSNTLPQKREAGEFPKAWMVVPVPAQTSLQSKKNPAPLPATAAVHRSIVPHESLTPPKTPRRWPLVAGAMVLLLAVLAIVVVTTGMDGGKVKEWRLRWLNSHSNVQVEDTDAGLWIRDGSKTASAPSVDK